MQSFSFPNHKPYSQTLWNPTVKLPRRKLVEKYNAAIISTNPCGLMIYDVIRITPIKLSLISEQWNTRKPFLCKGKHLGKLPVQNT